MPLFENDALIRAQNILSHITVGGHFQTPDDFHRKEYIDILSPKGIAALHALAVLIAWRIRKEDRPRYVTAPAHAGETLAGKVAAYLNIRFAEREDLADQNIRFVRMTDIKRVRPKFYCHEKADGSLDRASFLIVDLTATTGAYIRGAAQVIERAGGSAQNAFVVLDRRDEARKMKIRISSLVCIPSPKWRANECPLCRARKPLLRMGRRDTLIELTPA